ncbi:gamma-glutamyl-gamma-aminobutyrate hydrolase family protein [Mycolicibacterium goodii]|uniref:gamma-glutamyl-gamma-aminobutyrate hydrolase family protein n=1 Tax=Mycolicibacterium goodii TaxID=134601 RepID=UPI001BDCB0F8|nr:gamma-glutamyl-gamma-aminobutyrate hydrolase family protein [Mycolicibacterium goodii]MBU8820827.1 gamma-glutamyl-gamma-aminobutyrate hydrolase family protein [Mycolicibacterium goodii]
MRRQPVIGLTTYLEPIEWGKWQMPAVFTPLTYVSAVRSSGGYPVLLPTALDDVDDAVLDMLDGVIVVGGADIDPTTYGEDQDPETDPRPVRDRGELALLDAALRRDLPVLGVCRGMQLLNVHAGGSLIQHLPHQVGHHEHLPTPGEFGTHHVNVSQDSRLASIVGERPCVATYHHQAAATLGKGLTAVAWADDGTVEAIESDSHTYVLGIQWHAERDEGTPLIAAFVEQCTKTGAK